MRTGWALAACVAFAALSGKAAAQPVALFVPPDSDAELTDVCHRVEAELHLHGFEPIARAGGLGPNVAAALSGAARELSSFAAIGFTREAGEATVHVWLIDQRSGSEGLRSLTLAPHTSDAPSLIAVRTVDLLRAVTQEFPQKPEPEPEPELEATVPIAEEPPEPESPPRPERAWSLAIAGTLQWPGASYGLTFGPALGVFHRPLPYLQWGVWIGAPVLGPRVSTDYGSARVYRGLAVAELRLRVLHAGGFSLSPLAGAGVAFLQASGDPMAPLRPDSDVVFGAVAVLGLHVEQGLGSGFALGLSLRALAHVPELGVAVATAQAPLQQPVLEAALGIVVEL